MIRVCLLLMMVLTIAIICHGQGPQVEAAKLETTYDAGKNRTTVQLIPVKISGEIDKYHSLHMAPSFSYPGRQPGRPSIIDFELKTIVKARLLDSDLYVLFIVDGEKIHLSSNRSAIFRPVPGRRWIGERLVFRMPYDTFLRLTSAKKLDITFERVKFAVGALQLDALRLLASKMD